MLDLADALCKEQVSRVDSRARRFLRDAFQICSSTVPGRLPGTVTGRGAF